MPPVPSEAFFDRNLTALLYSETAANPLKGVAVFPEYGFDVVSEDFGGNGCP
ncbi:hypothetical protein NM151_1845 [Neisseria meningitidis NM151]|nr:hypothetical protein NM151_1845 [Neisseria meningitidis NM151]EQD18601.1 hypothetical protein NM3230_1816 [Neisseria meningitidis NM3230]CWN09464.1 Uncharacterised protein [Neisseria meningitidis]CWO95280.1 Uncharacterised protein [Neisseria meningitidis]CWR08808.1 Uncharacterised protein [Neisseria meningitidis]